MLEPNLLKWALWFGSSERERVVKQEWVDNVRISTVFLGLNYNFSDQGPPVLWETITFSNREDWKGETDRCAGNREQAQAMHAQMVERVREKLGHKKV